MEASPSPSLGHEAQVLPVGGWHRKEATEMQGRVRIRTVKPTGVELVRWDPCRLWESGFAPSHAAKGREEWDRV
ncbi:unnamed protein product [Lampetra planeri]